MYDTGLLIQGFPDPFQIVILRHHVQRSDCLLEIMACPGGALHIFPLLLINALLHFQNLRLRFDLRGI